MLAMIAAVAIENVERVDTLEMMLPEPGGEDAGHPGVEARAEQRHQPRFLEAVLIRPLPMIFELRLVARLVIRSEEHTSELQSLMRHSYADFILKKQNINHKHTDTLPYAF